MDEPRSVTPGILHASTAARSSTRADDRSRVVHAAGLGGWLTGTGGEHFRVDPAIVLGQDLAEVAGRVGDGPVADLAARDRQMGNGHREAAGL